MSKDKQSPTGDLRFLGHNLLFHPLAGVAWFLGLLGLGDWLHSQCIPNTDLEESMRWTALDATPVLTTGLDPSDEHPTSVIREPENRLGDKHDRVFYGRGGEYMLRERSLYKKDETGLFRIVVDDSEMRSVLIAWVSSIPVEFVGPE